MGFMCYLCYLYLFTGVQHDFYIRYRACPLTVTHRVYFFCCPWCCLSFLYLRLLITPYVFLNYYHPVVTRYWFLCYSVAHNMSPSLCAYVLFSEGTNFNLKLFGFQTFRLWMYLMKVITVTYLMKVIPETYLTKVIPEAYLMKIIPETYLVKVISETRRAH